MRLKVLTAALFIFGVILLLSWPWTVGEQPLASAPERVRLAFILRLGLYFIVTILVFFGAAVCAVLVARRTRQAYREEALNNVKDLIEGSLEDHTKRDE